MFEVMQTLLQPQIAMAILVGIAAFATILTVALPLMQGDRLQSRMKLVAQERAAIKARERARLFGAETQRGSLRRAPKSYMKQVVDRLNLQKLLEAEDTKEKLRMAGLRGQAPLFAFLFFRLVMPILLFFGAMFYLFVVNDFGKPASVRFIGCAVAAFVGFYAPNMYVSNRTQKRQTSIQTAFPDALDLLLICVESGMSIEAAFRKVSHEIGTQSIEMAEELILTTAELSYLQDRRQAYENLGKRTGLPGVKAVTTSLIQAEKYGTPLGQALRVMSQENRDLRMQAAEKKAAALPPKLTVPMIAFFLPVIFVVILGPAIVQVLATVGK